MGMQTLLSALIVNSHNVRILHWNIVGIDFDPVHEKLGSYYDILTEFVDDIAETCVMLEVPPVGIHEAFAILKEDRRPFTSLSGGKKYTSTESFELISEMFGSLIELYQEICSMDSLPGDVINKLQEHLYRIRKELQYKNKARLI